MKQNDKSCNHCNEHCKPVMPGNVIPGGGTIKQNRQGVAIVLVGLAVIACNVDDILLGRLYKLHISDNNSEAWGQQCCLPSHLILLYSNLCCKQEGVGEVS